MLPADVSWGDNPNGPGPRWRWRRPRPCPPGAWRTHWPCSSPAAKCMIMIGGREVDGQRGRC